MMGLTLSSFSNRGLNLSGTAALPGFRFCRSFKIKLLEISVSGIIWLLFGSIPVLRQGSPCHHHKCPVISGPTLINLEAIWA